MRFRKMKALTRSLTAGVALASMAALAQTPIVYPKKGQSEAKQNKDTSECQLWAKQQTGFDPAAPVAQAPAPNTHGETARGAGRGAAVGAIGGAIGGNAGKGAAIGAGVGAGAGAIKKRQIAKEHEQAQATAQTQRNAQLVQYNKAFGTCMSGRGYSVSQ